MLNKDLVQKQNIEIVQAMSNAFKEGNDEEMATAMQSFMDGVAGRIEQEYSELQGTADRNVLQARGIRQLTSAETKFYQSFIEAAKSENPRQAVANLNIAMPETVVDAVIADMQGSHPLLSAISFQNANGLIKMFTNAQALASNLGTWGVLTSAIATELAGKLKETDLTQAKYSAYIPIPKDYTKFNFGFAPAWVDNYVRLILSESCAYGLEKSILLGDGKAQFIGMAMDTSTATEGKYTAKTKVALTDLGTEAYGAAIAPLAKDANGDYRVVPEVLLVVNPVDYIKKVHPATCVKNMMGQYVFDVYSYPTQCIQSAVLAEGAAILGIAKNYFAGVGAGNSGTIEFDDSCQFLEDNRVFTTRLYGMGTPIDNTSFEYLDVSGLEPTGMDVAVRNVVKTKATT